MHPMIEPSDEEIRVAMVAYDDASGWCWKAERFAIVAALRAAAAARSMRSEPPASESAAAGPQGTADAG